MRRFMNTIIFFFCMQISFFEEFPSEQNLKKLDSLSTPTKLYIAAESVREFKRITSKIKNKRIEQFIYWPLLQQKEGYWISPFSEKKALIRIFKELEREKIPVMLDLELPTMQNPCLYLTELPNFWRNKRLIQRFVQNYPRDIYLAEYYPEGKRSEQMLTALGLHYTSPKVKIIKMLYRSMHHFSDDFLRKELEKGRKEYGSNFIPSFGVIAPGIMGKEPVLSPEQLGKDLQIAKRAGIKEVILFRLGGLDEKYGKVVKKF